MKKQLLSTSAIALGIAASAPALAQDWDVGVGGYYVTHIGINDVSGSGLPAGSDFEGLDIATDGEIFITPSITLDNGLTFGANIQLETADGADMDEVYISISGDSFGHLDIGSENSAGAKMMVSAPTVGAMYIQSPSTSAFIPFTTAGQATSGGFGFVTAPLSPYTEVGGNSDVPRISYYTPDFNGFKVGVSYAPDNGTSDGATALTNSNGLGVISDIFDLGVSYNGSMGTTDVSLSARWGTGDLATGVGTSQSIETWGVGASVGFGALTVGAHYAENDNIATGTGPLSDSNGWSFGVTYDAPGAWSFGAQTMQGEVDNGSVVGTKSEREAYLISANRNLGPGVDWSIWAYQEERDDKATVGTDVEGTVVGTSISLSF